MNAPRVAGVVLAAGLSTRLGRPKQLERLNGETLVERTVRTAREAGLAPVIAVILDAELIPSLQHMGAVPLLNRHSYEGLSSSIRVGVNAAQATEIDGLILMTCDQIALTSGHLRDLCAHPKFVTASRYAGRSGVPAYFPRKDFAALLQLEGDMGARELLKSARTVECESLALDVDTEADLEKARAFIASSS